MKVFNRYYRTIWLENTTCLMINQNKLPHSFEIYQANTYRDTCHAIKTMITRGAGAIGAAAGFAMAQAAMEAPANSYAQFIRQARKEIEATRPTAQNLFQAVELVYQAACISKEDAYCEAQKIANDNLNDGKRIGEHGSRLLRNGTQVLTHCNAGWLAFVDWGTALAPIYRATQQGKKIFVYADETRPRLQGARLTAWELAQQGIPHKIIPDNAAAMLMKDGKIDIVITGADRIAANGDTANKIGTLEKAICAKEFGIPYSTFDKNCPDGSAIPIEYREQEEVTMMEGIDIHGQMHRVQIANADSEALNPAFDVTPAKYITGFITEKGIVKPPYRF
jgi:S-methyl-5-thioribose-1-phosphate isomerase